MKTILKIFVGILVCISISAYTMPSGGGKTSLSGKITNKETGESLPLVTIYFPDLKIGTLSGADGTYRIENLPQSKILLQVSLIGHKTIIEAIDLSAVTTKDFALELSVREINEIVITGTSHSVEKNRTPTPITIVPKITLLQNSSSNIIDAIANQPGISQVTTGSGISKPVIRGLGYNRVVVVNDGIRQEGQQWGDEHGIEIDEFAVSKVEILKGPASLSYGSDAMAGVINMISAPSLNEGTIKGNVLGNYQTNNGLIAYSGNVAGNLKGFVWDARYSSKMAHAYKNKYDGYVFGSGFKETTMSGIVGVNKSWGYSHIQFSAYHLIPGIVEGGRDSASGRFVKEFAADNESVIDTIVSDKEMKSYTLGIPKQDVGHSKIVLNNNIYLKKGNLKTVLGFQQNRRKEYVDVIYPDDFELYFKMNTINYDARYVFPEKNQLQTSFGVNGMSQRSENEGIDFLVPAYSLFDIGGFVISKKSFEKIDLSGGMRYDIRKITGDELLLDTLGSPTTENNPFHVKKFNGFNATFSNVTGSIGATYQFSDYVYSKLNLSRGFRTPNIAELGANGEHEGAERYEFGNPSMKAETSWQIDYAFGWDAKHISLELDVFNNYINNFIYITKLNSIFGGDSIVDFSNPIPAFKFTQGNAKLFGGEVAIDLHPHPLDWLHFETSFSYVQAVQKNATDSTKYLPMIPPAKITSDLRADIKKAGKFFENMYFKIGIDEFFSQNKFYSAYGTETRTPGYLLVNFGMGTDFVSKKNMICSLYFSINNLTNAVYQSHLSRLKYSDENNVTGRAGVYNMGRNMSIKLLIPINIKKPNEVSGN